ncbi:MAG: FG-GAP-like repeat-containing protein [Flavobacteriales bacterium]|jgi:hypothetical protein
MKKLSSLLVAGLLGTLPALAQDNCLTAIPITAGTYVIDTIDGPEVPLPVCASGGNTANRGEWYVYTAPATVSVTVTSDLPVNTAVTPGLDTRVHVYTGTCGALSCYDGDDDAGSGYLSVALFNLQAGQSVYIAWDNRWESRGFSFSVIEGPPFSEAVSFSNVTVPVTGTMRAAVDMNNDDLDDVVGINTETIDNVAYTTGVTIAYQQSGGGFTAVSYPTPQIPNTPSWSLCAGDLDGNGWNDLLIAGGSKVTLLFADADGNGFSNDTTYNQYVFCQRSNMVDINNDGLLDAFSCHDVQPNVYFINNGTGTFTYYQGGLGDTPNGGNYGSIWTDIDGDGDVDMFIAKCRGGNQVTSTDQFHRNNGDGTFTEVAAQYNLANFTQTWSAAWGDFDNDGDMDVMVGASSFSAGGHKLMRNDGNTFTDVTAGSGYDTFTGTNIEHITHDFNNDGYLDIMGGGNTIMMNNGDMTFTPNPVGFDVGAVGDLDNDGYMDIQTGGTARINNGVANNYIRIMPQGTVSNKNAIGARVTITTASGTQIRDIRSGDGFRYMSYLGAHFGLGQDEEVLQVTVRFPSGIVNTIDNPAINGTVTIVEDVNTSVTTVTKEQLVLFPVPTADLLFISGDYNVNQPVRVFDMNGKLVKQAVVNGNHITVGGLTPGMYVVEVQTNDGPVQRSFAKE